MQRIVNEKFIKRKYDALSVITGTKVDTEKETETKTEIIDKVEGGF